MEIYEATAKGPLKIPGYIDADDVTIITVFWGAPVFETDKVYREGDICRPTTDNGYYYSTTKNGVSASTEPTTWSQTSQVSGTVTFEAVPYDLLVLPDETITSSEWIVVTGVDTFVADADYAVGDTVQPTTYVGYYYVCATAGNVGSTEPVSWSTTEETIGTAVFEAVPYVLAANPLNDNFTTSVEIDVLSTTITEFTLTNHIVKSNGEERDKSFKYKVREQ